VENSRVRLEEARERAEEARVRAARAEEARVRAARAEEARVRAAERTRPGLRFGYALSLFAELAPLRAGHVVAGGDATWSASLAALRRLSDDLVPDRDVLDGREVLVWPSCSGVIGVRTETKGFVLNGGGGGLPCRRSS
jgi:hypothetical protein